jgi:hypothetical protein
MIKVISLFLIAILALGMFGKLRVPKIRVRGGKKCPSCGSFLIGKTPCVCTKPKP